MKTLLTVGVSAVLLSSVAGAVDASISVTSKGLCLNLPPIPFVPSLPCLKLPPLPTQLSALPLPALPLGAIPRQLGPLPKLPALDDKAAEAAAKLGGDSAPDYSRLTQFLFHFPDTRLETLPRAKLPYLSLINTAKGGANEWIVPYSQESGSVAAATGMRAAWQRFEDRYYWRANVELNNPALYLTHCLMNLNMGLQTRAVRARVTVGPEEVGADPKISGKYPFSSPDGLKLDSYLPFPQVENREYCAGVTPNLIPEIPVMYLPGLCFTVFGTPTGVCLEGEKTYVTNPLAPAPLYFNMNEARRRLADAVAKAHTDYLLEYQEDVVGALFNKNNKYFFPLPWQSLLPGNGAVIAPVMNQQVSPKPIADLANQVRQLYQSDPKTRLFALNSSPYFFQGLARSPSLSLHALPTRKDVLKSPPGVWLYEEYKRLLPPTSLPFQEQFGYTTFFEAYNEPKVALLPEDVAGKLTHPVLYYATGILLDLTGFSVVLPQPMRIPEYMGGLPFVGPQARYDWKSVPEGYAIPKVKGQPRLDYGVIR